MLDTILNIMTKRRHLEFFKTPNDDKVSSARFLNYKNPSREKLYTQLPGPSKIHQIPAGLKLEKKISRRERQTTT